MALNFTKKLILTGIVSLCITAVYGQLIPIPLNQRIDNSTTILEGQVISQNSYWDETKTQIYTSNVIEVYKLFKGTLSTNQVEIITKGGVVGNDMQRVSHTLELNIGDIGVFTAVPNTFKIANKTKLTKLKAYSGLQGFIKYDLKSGTAKDVFSTYKNVSKDVHAKIIGRTKTNIKTVQKAPFKME